MSKRVILGPFNRIEGDLEVKIEIQDNLITNAWVNTPLFRGFEQILQGKDPRDSLVYAPRICGICSVSQSVAASSALRMLNGTKQTKNGELVTNLLLSIENVADHLTHFYLFFMPDFARDAYVHKKWFSNIQPKYKAQVGTAQASFLTARANFLNTTAILAGKWPHTLSIQPGGSTKSISSEEKIQLMNLIATFRLFLEDQLFGCPLEQFNDYRNLDDIEAHRKQFSQSNFTDFLNLAEDLDLEQLGQIPSNFLSYGAYQTINNSHTFKAGHYKNKFARFNQNVIAEDVSHSWLAQTHEPKHPSVGSTIPDIGQKGYSWNKAPRLAGEVIEVGALSRQVVDQHPLILELNSHSGSNAKNRVIARLTEVARLIPIMETWCSDIEPADSFCNDFELPSSGTGYGLVEAARGSLGHWISVENKKILNYQIIAPTTWNFSPRDTSGQPGALEQALAGTHLKNGIEDVSIQHIIRSFDPCMVCTVH